MIESFASDETKKIFLGKTSTKLPKDIQRAARVNCSIWTTQTIYKIYWLRPVTGLKNLKAIEQDSTVSASMTNGEFVSIGLAIKPKMSKSWIITDESKYDG